MKINLFTNKYVLYFIAFLSIVNILGYFINRNYGAITFFVLVAFLTFSFNKNMILVLGISLFATNLLGGLAEIFMMQNINIDNKKEGFINKPNQVDNTKINIEGTVVNNPGDNSFQNSMFAEFIDKKVDNQISNKFEKSKDIDSKKDFLQTQMTADNIKEIEQKTNELLKEQDLMMKQIADFGPLLNNSLQAIGNVTSGNIGSVINELTNNLDSLYVKYPDAFPSDYKETSEKMKATMSKVKDETGKIDNLVQQGTFKSDPKFEKEIIEFKEKIGFS